jgi:hypothetical protein
VRVRLLDFVVAAAAAAFPALASTPAPIPGTAAVRAVGKTAMSVSLTFFSPEPLPESSAFAGRLFLDGERNGIAVSGPVEAQGHVSTATLRVPFAEITPAVFRRLRPQTFEYELRGQAGEFHIAVSGSGRWSDVHVDEAARAAMRRWIVVGPVGVKRIALRRSVASVRLDITNPLPVDVRVSSVECRLESDGRDLGRGRGSDILLRQGATSRVELRVDLDHAALARAAGSAILSGGELDGVVAGRIVLSLAGGTAELPFSVPGRISIL